MMARKCSPGIKLANMWLAGHTYSDVLSAEWFKRQPDAVRNEAANVWIGLETAFKLLCDIKVTEIDMVYNPAYRDRHTRERKRRHQ